MIKNIIFMLIGGFIATAVLTVVALCEAAGRADRLEESLEEDSNKDDQERQGLEK